jgi:hypothetical protein
MQTRTEASLAPIRALIRSVLKRTAERAQTWHKLGRRLAGTTYRPEKHYMRGPGPKWREKYAHAGARRPSDAAQGG